MSLELHCLADQSLWETLLWKNMTTTNQIHTQKPVNVNKLRENNNTMFWVSATAEVGRVMVMAGRMEAIVAKVVLVASGGSTLRMNLGITKDLQSITFVTEASSGDPFYFSVFIKF